MSKENKTSDKQQNGNDFIADESHRLLRELRQTYLVNLDDDGQPKASMQEIMNLWDRVNRELQIVTID